MAAGVEVVLCINSGSSSLKFALYDMGAGERLVVRGAMERIGQSHGRMWIQRENREQNWQGEFLHHQAALDALFALLGREHLPHPVAVGHRVVSGGPALRQHCLLDDSRIRQLHAALPFAPLHLPPEIAAIEAVAASWPDIPQAACLDTAFHQTIPDTAARYPLPRNLWHEGVRKYGFHGLSYEYVLSRLPDGGKNRTIIAHLGNGASLAAVRDGHCQDTTMGLTPMGGVVMSTRSGDLDPGVLLYLMEEKGYNGSQLERLLNHLSGLLGISGISGDMQTLLGQQDGEPHAAEAIGIFAYSIRKAVGSLMAVLGGLDCLVFTGGIGENAPAIRWSVCRPLEGLGLQLDAAANEGQSERLSRPGSPVEILRIPTDEDLVIARHTWRLLQS